MLDILTSELDMLTSEFDMLDSEQSEQGSTCSIASKANKKNLI